MRVQLISGVFEHSMFHIREIYALENASVYIALNGMHIQTINFLYTQQRTVQTHLQSTIQYMSVKWSPVNVGMY